ncbi:methyl-accepting chemotaxis protein [Caulobacter sp.]|uniref:methyl-accepting chemotaxis protein n=1 Tax=Caulobacter sp. TaxID=78 RepID=UPI001B221877|nr:methyl-accepting chemotaxis protein [Caulobacter sp.]MBO9545208.1 HAMP domain-containing protein [Caulobacter sp.]
MASLGQKVMGAAAGAALLCAATAGTGLWVAMSLDSALTRSEASAKILRLHMHADMMHDALRADVMGGIMSSDPALGVDLKAVRADLAEHTEAFKTDIAESAKLAQDPAVKAALSEVEAPLAAYIAAAGEIVGSADTDIPGARAKLPGFAQQFSVLEGKMEEASTKIEAAAVRDSKAAKSMSLLGQVVMGALLVAAGLFAVALMVAAKRGLVSPLVAITHALRRLSAGDLSVVLPKKTSNDEIGQMTDALQTFHDTVEARRKELEAADVRDALEIERQQAEQRRNEAEATQKAVVESLAEALQHMSRGDLSHRLERPFPAGYEKLRVDFNVAVEKLSSVIAASLGAVTAIHGGTAEITAAADDLSGRTERQAASLEEAVAALDEITSTVRLTAEGASRARKVVERARTAADASGSIVSQAVEAMGAIEKSSEQIGQIIGVIDEIAFQTNLLALNAGVEAARAGEAGRGFAVVAQEVRALAQRSAEAAKEIKTLISASTAEVGQGVEYVGKAGEALRAIADEVDQIDGLVGEMAASTQEQARGLAEVNTTMNQMDQVTQRNAAMVEETTAASHALAQEATRLAQRMGELRIAQDGGQRRAA